MLPVGLTLGFKRHDRTRYHRECSEDNAHCGGAGLCDHVAGLLAVAGLVAVTGLLTFTRLLTFTAGGRRLGLQRVDRRRQSQAP